MGPFHRRGVDHRFVRQVVTVQHQPSHWLPMDIWEVECKIMEVKKYTAPYYDIDAKFRRPDMELITAYHVQNPFLMGMYNLRKEQLAMQMAQDHHTIKEKFLYFPTNFRNLELILRNNFQAAIHQPIDKMMFFTNSEQANQALSDMETDHANPRLMLVARVAIGLTREIDDELWKQAFSGKFHLKLPYFSKPEDNLEGQLPIDTFCNEDKTIFIKNNFNEVYPEQVLVYRDKRGGADSRTSRLTDVIQHCQLSYRSGKRFNPDEVAFEGTPDQNGTEDDDHDPKAKNQKKSMKSLFTPRKSNRVVTQEPQPLMGEGAKKNNGAKGAIPKTQGGVAEKDARQESIRNAMEATSLLGSPPRSRSGSPDPKHPDHMRMQIRGDIVREHIKKSKFANQEE
ncbi:hypothetical protein TCAL_11891 [Tigriopus californicus]|uniref:Uncharacterized protein n=1 Tax=Tigriopus californicus TaxID=6832 RepID=A0A553PJX7_TIGCA|nr:uncharacterized protein LOC131890619 [Tigriopus californicus]TRY77991.1 hypothetical protein TCAL_11891 [Tigriopus californicus]|eukprot:TCALIF_11891-PA protein Name:"Protein of unknown function" AED:0.00 eAED:0.00 QI:102/1/1/1/0.8/0.83/6/108/395